MQQSKVYVILEDSREHSLVSDEELYKQTYYSEESVCLTLVGMIADFEEEHRAEILSDLENYGPIWTYNQWASAWLYCPTYIEVDVDTRSFYNQPQVVSLKGKTTTGTAYFLNRQAANRYYKGQGYDLEYVQDALDEGRIFVGKKPKLRDKQFLVIDDGQYFIVD